MNLAFIVNNVGNSEKNYKLLKLINKIKTESNKVIQYIYFKNEILNPDVFVYRIKSKDIDISGDITLIR